MFWVIFPICTLEIAISDIDDCVALLDVNTPVTYSKYSVKLVAGYYLVNG